MNEKLEKLNQEIEETEKKLRWAQQEEKRLTHQAKALTRKERTHRLCTRAAMLESYLPHPEAITDEQVSLFLKLLFLSFCRIVVVGFQIGCVQFVHIERLVRLHNGRSAFHVPFYVKDVSLVGVGQVFISGMLRDIKLVAEKRAHTTKLQNTLAAVHDCNFVLGHQLLS